MRQIVPTLSLLILGTLFSSVAAQSVTIVPTSYETGLPCPCPDGYVYFDITGLEPNKTVNMYVGYWLRAERVGKDGTIRFGTFRFFPGTIVADLWYTKPIGTPPTQYITSVTFIVE